MLAAIIMLTMGSGLEGQGTDRPLKIWPNYRLHPSSVSQTETFIAKSPADQHTFFVSCNTISFVPFFISEGIYSTTTSGLSWTGSDTCAGYPMEYHGGDPGITIDRNGTFILTHLGRTPFVGLFCNYSLDRGQTWSAQTAISTDDLERASLATDATAGSSFYGRSYAVWTKLTTPFPLMFAFTDDVTHSWSSPKQVNNPVNRCAGGDVAVGPGGVVYACWAGVTSSAPFKEIQVGLATSSSGGNAWTVNENIFPVNGITGVLPQKSNIRVNGLPSIAVDTTNGPRKGWIYIVTGQKDLAPAGSDPDIIMYRSANGGQTWSQGIRVNQDALNNGKIQYFPAIHVDRSGTVNVIFYDDRRTTSDSTGVFLARSADGGNSWREYEISDSHFKPVPIGGMGQGYQGDNIDLSSDENTLIPVWMDNRTGVYQIWSALIPFADIDGIRTILTPPGYWLGQNIPNPCIGSAVIHFGAPARGGYELSVYALSGKVLRTFSGQVTQPGEQRVVVDVSGLGEGEFVYRLKINGCELSRKMIIRWPDED